MKTVEQKTTSKVDGLTIVRFFAALGVFFDHYADHLLAKGPQFLNNLLNRGSAGVMLFFVLSGFLLVMVYAPRSHDGKVDKRKFYIARFARVYPAYLFCLIITIPLMILWVKSVGWGPNLNKPLFFLTKFTMTDYWYLLSQETKTSANWQQQGWSLTCEGLFYFLFPIVLPHFMKLKSFALVLGAILNLVILTILGLFYREDPFNPGALGVFSVSPIIRLGDFFLGMFAAKIMLDNRSKLGSLVKFTPHVIAFTILYQAITPEIHPNHILFLPLRLVYTLLISVLGLGFVVSTPPMKDSKVKSFFVLLGEASYGLYLIQLFVVGFIGTLVAKVLHLEAGHSLSWPSFLGYLSLTVVLSIAMHKYMETPVRLWITKRFSRA